MNMPIATAVICITFDEMPDIEELKSTVESLTGEGRVTKAELTILKQVIINLS